MKRSKLILSCEHASNTVPPAFRHAFKQHEAVLQTHRGIDLGAGEIAHQLSETLGCDLMSASISRLLIDFNRSLSHPSCFTEFSKRLSKQEKQQLIDQYYLPYRQATETLIKNHIDKGYQVLHLSIHSFTPVFDGVKRNASIGLLYDPKQHGEKEVAREWHSILNQHTDYRVRLNYPYKGTANGFTTALRKRYPQENYLGIEVEVNQALVQDKASLKAVTAALSDSLKELLQLL